MRVVDVYKLRRVYENSLSKMKNTFEDWKKVDDAFQKIIIESGNDPETVKAALQFYDQLEKEFEKAGSIDIRQGRKGGSYEN